MRKKSTFQHAYILLLLLFTAPASAGQESQEPVLLVFGDSLSAAYGIKEHEGWVNLLSNKLEQLNSPYRVVNGSVSGETTDGGLARLPAMLNTYKPALVVLELGGNDGLRGLPVSSTTENLEAMVSLITQSGAAVLLAGIQIPPNYGPRYTTPFNEQFGKIAASKGLPLVPFLIDGIPQQPELMQNDGIHPNAEAQGIILDNVWKELSKLLSE